MSDLQVFLVLVAGLALGIIIGNRVAKADLPARVGWAAAGAIPGSSFLSGDPRLMLTLVLVLPLLAWRFFYTRRRHVGS